MNMRARFHIQRSRVLACESGRTDRQRACHVIPRHSRILYLRLGARYIPLGKLFLEATDADPNDDRERPEVCWSYRFTIADRVVSRKDRDYLSTYIYLASRVVGMERKGN